MANLADSDKEIKKKYLSGGAWCVNRLRKRANAKKGKTPGSKKDKLRCQLTPIAGLPRKAFLRARSRKWKEFAVYCAFMDKLNK